ncbi:MAG TPA: methyltransferase domain-containing protein [Candidatus Dormibacteraeota bacterium]|jgi:SAM-dependent methyltransferase
MEQPVADWWRTWFGPGYLSLYDGYLSERTPVEVDHLEALLALTTPARVLDLACGQGRHAIELARRGYEVTGVDLSEYLLEVARARARAAGVTVRLLRRDMREPLSGERFDLILSLFTSFGYFEDEAEDHRVLTGVARMLERGGRFVLEVLNGQREREHFEARQWFSVGKTAVMEERRLERSARRLVVTRTISTPNGRETNAHSLRIYDGAEIEASLLDAGFADIRLYGDWSGERLTPESARVLAVATMGT